MNSQHLEEFLILARELNCTAAAQQAFVARATLIEHIGELEHELGCRLFARCDGRYELTPIGRRFVRTASDMLADAEAVRREYQELSGNFLSLRIAATNLPWLESLVHQARKAIVRRKPKAVVEVAPVSGAASTIEALANGTNDIVVAGRKHWEDDVTRGSIPEGFKGFKLGTESIELLVTEGSPLFDKDQIHACDLDGMAFILPPDIYEGYRRDGVVERFADKGARIQLRPMPIGDHFEYFARPFDDCIGVVPSTLKPRFGLDRRAECRVFGLADLSFKTDFYALFRKDFAEDPLARDFMEEMKRIAEKRS